MKAAVDAASAAFPAWRDTSILSRQQVMFRLQHLIRNKMVRPVLRSLHAVLNCLPIHTYHCVIMQSLYILIQKELAANITEEQGKTLADAEGDVLRGLRKLLLS